MAVFSNKNVYKKLKQSPYNLRELLSAHPQVAVPVRWFEGVQPRASRAGRPRVARGSPAGLSAPRF